MTFGPTAFDTLMEKQARDIEASAGPSLEHVAASVSRVAGFTNTGIGASGHSIAVDEPAAFGGGGSAADPAELLLIAVGASLSVTLTVHASLSAVPIDAINLTLAGNLDAGRFFKPSTAPGAGFADMRIGVTIHSAAEPIAVRRVLETSLLASPVLRSLAAAPMVTLTVNGVEA